MNKIKTMSLIDLKLWLEYYFPKGVFSSFHSNLIKSETLKVPNSLTSLKASEYILQMFKDIPPGMGHVIEIPCEQLEKDPLFWHNDWWIKKEWLDCTELELVQVYDFNKVVKWCENLGIYCQDLNPIENKVRFGASKDYQP